MMGRLRFVFALLLLVACGTDSVVEPEPRRPDLALVNMDVDVDALAADLVVAGADSALACDALLLHLGAGCTSSPPPPPPPPPPGGVSMVAVVGMSNTGEIIHGIHRLTNPTISTSAGPWCYGSCEPAGYVSSGFWPGPLVYKGSRSAPAVFGGIGKGVLSGGSGPNGPTWGWYYGTGDYWRYFDDLNARYPASDVYYMVVGEFNPPTAVPDAEDMAQAEAVIDSLMIRGFAAERIHVAPVHYYETATGEAAGCPPLGDDGVAHSRALVDHVVATKGVRRAPDVALLTDAERRDGCHMYDAAADTRGSALRSYFYP